MGENLPPHGLKILPCRKIKVPMVQFLLIFSPRKFGRLKFLQNLDHGDFYFSAWYNFLDHGEEGHVLSMKNGGGGL